MARTMSPPVHLILLQELDAVFLTDDERQHAGALGRDYHMPSFVQEGGGFAQKHSVRECHLIHVANILNYEDNDYIC